MSRYLLFFLIIVGLSGCHKREASPKAGSAQTQIVKVSPAETTEELAARETVLKVVGVHYVTDVQRFINIIIFEDMATGQRLRNVIGLGKTLPQSQLQDDKWTFWAVGDQAKIFKRDDGNIVVELITSERQTQ